MDGAGDTLAVDHVMGVTFLMSIYRTVFLSLDCLYYAYTNHTNPEDSKRYSFIHKLRPGEKAIIIDM